MAATRIVFDNRSAISLKLKDATDAGLRSVMQVTEAQAKSLVPIRTGFLYSTLTGQPSGNLRYSVTALAEYAGEVELGTSGRAAKPYLVPAALFAASLLPSLFRHEFRSRFSA